MPDEVLSQLKDIHMPPEVSWWPLAFGYWIVLGLIIVGLILLVRRYRRHWVRRTAQREFERLLASYRQHQNAAVLTQGISTLMRRISISLLPREQVAGITGEQWIAVLQNLSHQRSALQRSAPPRSSPPRSSPLSPTTATALTTLVHRPGARQLLTEHVEQLIKECRQWIQGLPTAQVSK